jgi:hypothetical protein
MAKVVTLASNKVNLIIVNPFTYMWQTIHGSQLLSHAFPRYLKVVEIAMVHVLDFVENWRYFSLLLSWRTKSAIVWTIICN